MVVDLVAGMVVDLVADLVADQIAQRVVDFLAGTLDSVAGSVAALPELFVECWDQQ